MQGQITISFKDSALGCTKEVSFARNENCDTCSGSGAKPGAQQTTCTVCMGKGYLVEKLDKVNLAQVECTDCDSMGVTVPACLTCSGLGSIRSKVTESINIPAGVYTGLILRSQGKGNQMKKGTGPAGDLLLTVTVEDHPVFRRDAENVLSDAKIPFTKAVFGGTVEVETLKGTSKIEIQAGTQDGTLHVIKGAGMKKVTKASSAGDHIIKLHIEVPTNLNAK